MSTVCLCGIADPISRCIFKRGNTLQPLVLTAAPTGKTQQLHLMPHVIGHFFSPLSLMFSPDHRAHATDSDQRASSKPEWETRAKGAHSLILPLHCFLISRRFSSNGSDEPSAGRGAARLSLAIASSPLLFRSSHYPQLSAGARIPEKACPGGGLVRSGNTKQAGI